MIGVLGSFFSKHFGELFCGPYFGEFLLLEMFVIAPDSAVFLEGKRQERRIGLVDFVHGFKGVAHESFTDCVFVKQGKRRENGFNECCQFGFGLHCFVEQCFVVFLYFQPGKLDAHAFKFGAKDDAARCGVPD